MSDSIIISRQQGAIINQYLVDQIRSCESWKKTAAAVCKVAFASFVASLVVASVFKALPIIPVVLTLSPIVVALMIIYRQRNSSQGLWEEIAKNNTLGGFKVDDILYYSKMALVAGLAYSAASILAIPILAAGAATYLVMRNKISQLKQMELELQAPQLPLIQQAPVYQT